MLPAVRRDGEVGDRRVFGLARAVRHDRAVARFVRDLDGLQRFGQRADLVDLDQDGVGDALGDALRAGASALVTKRSSPTSCTFLPMASVSAFQPAQSSSAMPSSIETIGIAAAQVFVEA